VSLVGKIDLEFEVNGKKMKLSFAKDVAGIKIAEIVQSLQGIQTPSESQPEKNESSQVHSVSTGIKRKSNSKMGKLVQLLEKLEKIGWFTSEHVRELYLHEYDEELKSSTISTYLARLCEDGYLEKQGSVKKREYKVIRIEKTIKNIV